MGDYYTKIEMDSRYALAGESGVVELSQGDQTCLVEHTTGRTTNLLVTILIPTAGSELVVPVVYSFTVEEFAVAFLAPIPAAGYKLMWCIE